MIMMIMMIIIIIIVIIVIMLVRSESTHIKDVQLDFWVTLVQKK